MARRGAPRTNLPVERGAFVGRERGLLAIAKALGDGQPAVVLLFGSLGIGKTRLALRAAARELPRFGHEGGVWLVECLGAEDGTSLVRLVGLMLGLLPDASASADVERDRIAAVLCERGPSLVVIDGVDGVVGALTSIVALSRLAPGVRFIVTGREGTAPSSDVQPLAVPALSTRRERRAADLSEAGQLFLERANEARGSHARSFDRAERAAIEGIAAHLDGVPQAIEVAAARCRVLAPTELLERLPRHAPATVSAGRRSALAGVVAWSLDLLQPWERATLAQAVIFHGGFSLDAARDVIDLSEVSGAPSVDAAIESLVEKALLKVRPATDDDDTPRFDHPTAVRELIVQVRPQRKSSEPVKASTLELLPGARSGEGAVAEVPRLELFSTREALVQRHAQWVLSRCAQWRESVDGHGGQLARRHLEAEQDNLLAVVRRALADDAAGLTSVTNALLALFALEPAMTTRGPHDLFARLLDHVVDRAEPLGVGAALLARMLELRARVRRNRGLLSAYRDDLLLALAQARRARDRLLEGRALANLGSHALYTGDHAAARAHYDEAIAIIRAVGDTRVEARCVGFFGLLEEELGHLDLAVEHYERAVAGHTRVGDRRYEGIHTGQLARARLSQGDLDRATELLRRALVVHRELNNRRYEATALLLQGDIALIEGELEDAHMLWTKSAGVAREVGDPGLLVLAHARLATTSTQTRAHDVVVDMALKRLDDANVHTAVAVLRGVPNDAPATDVRAAERVRHALTSRPPRDG